MNIGRSSREAFLFSSPTGNHWKSRTGRSPQSQKIPTVTSASSLRSRWPVSVEQTSGVGDQRAPARYTMGIRQNSHYDLTPDRREESAVKSGENSGSRSRDYEWFISGVGDGRERGRTTSSPKIRRIRMVIWWGWMGDSKDLQLLPPIGFRSAVGLLAYSLFFLF